MKYTVKELTEETALKLDVVIDWINQTLINKNGKINPEISKLDDIVINRKNISYLIDNIFYHTSFLNNNNRFATRVSLILLGIKEPSICECGNKINKPLIYNGKTIGLNKYCSQSCANRYSNYKRTKEFYQLVGKKAGETLKKNGTSSLYKIDPSLAHTPEAKLKRKKTCIEKYGIENPGVLGAYSSKSGEVFIRKYIIDNNINEKQCYFKGGGVNGKEYFQKIFSPEKDKFIYFSYDLVVFDEGMKNIELVLEYNGPWHYNKSDYKDNPNGFATPYKNSKTIKETYEFDLIKLNHMKKITDNIYIYWLKNDSLIKYNNKL